MDTAVFAARNFGYELHYTANDDDDSRKDRRGLAVLTHVDAPHAEVETVRIESRNALLLHVSELAMTVAGVHLDDRSESTRQGQARALLGHLRSIRNNMIIGDHNSLHHDGLLSLGLRSSLGVSRHLPSVEPGETAPNLAKLRRVASLGKRLGEMANGGTVQIFEAAKYVDGDPDHKPTKGFAQLDRSLTNFAHRRNGIVVGQTEVGEAAELSDHRPISTTLYY